jgi:hypothetical protein
MRYLTSIALLLCLAIVSSWGCSDRDQAPSTTADSTIVFAAKHAPAPTATITFGSRVSRKSGRLLDVGRVFTIQEHAWVRAFVDLQIPSELGSQPQMFHLVWIDPEGSAIFKKRVDVRAADASEPIQTSISIGPDKREPGVYALQVYHFRERIAEKTFELRAPGTAASDL